MAKKRKLNSKNPKYQQESKDTTPKIKKKVLMCHAKIRDYNGNDTGRKAAVHGVWYEDDE